MRTSFELTELKPSLFERSCGWFARLITTMLLSLSVTLFSYFSLFPLDYCVHFLHPVIKSPMLLRCSSFPNHRSAHAVKLRKMPILSQRNFVQVFLRERSPTGVVHFPRNRELPSCSVQPEEHGVRDKRCLWSRTRGVFDCRGDGMPLVVPVPTLKGKPIISSLRHHVMAAMMTGARMSY